MSKLKILVGCECSQVITKAFRDLGIEAYSCDLKPAEINPEWHLQMDLLIAMSGTWDLMIAHPVCTYLSSSGMHWTTRGLRDPKLTDEAVEFTHKLLNATHIKHIAIENPVGVLSTRLRKPDQIINPYEFGHDASKKTCLWLKNLPKLVPTNYIEPRIIGGKKRWANQTDSGQNRLGPSPERAAIRSKTYEGIGKAMADQWSKYIEKVINE